MCGNVLWTRVRLQTLCIPTAGRQLDDLFLTPTVSQYLAGPPLPAWRMVGREKATVLPCFLTEPSKQALAAYPVQIRGRCFVSRMERM